MFRLLFTKSVHSTFWQILHTLCCLGQIPEYFVEDSTTRKPVLKAPWKKSLTITGEALTLRPKDADFWY